MISTVSIAKTGTPFRHTRLSAFAYCNGILLALLTLFDYLD